MQKAAIKLLQKLTIKKYIEGYGMLQRNIFIYIIAKIGSEYGFFRSKVNKSILVAFHTQKSVKQ